MRPGRAGLSGLPGCALALGRLTEAPDSFHLGLCPAGRWENHATHRWPAGCRLLSGLPAVWLMMAPGQPRPLRPITGDADFWWPPCPPQLPFCSWHPRAPPCPASLAGACRVRGAPWAGWMPMGLPSLPAMARAPRPGGKGSRLCGAGCSLPARRAHAPSPWWPVGILRASLGSVGWPSPVLVILPGLSQWHPRSGVPLTTSGTPRLRHQPRPAAGQQRQPPLCPHFPAGEGCRGGRAREAPGPAPTTSVPRCLSRWTGCPWRPAPTSLTAPAASRPGTRCAAGVSSRAGECGAVPSHGAPSSPPGLPQPAKPPSWLASASQHCQCCVVPGLSPLSGLPRPTPAPLQTMLHRAPPGILHGNPKSDRSTCAPPSSPPPLLRVKARPAHVAAKPSVLGCFSLSPPLLAVLWQSHPPKSQGICDPRGDRLGPCPRRCTRKGQCGRAARPDQWLWSYGDSHCLYIQSLLPAHHPRQEPGQVRRLLPPARGTAPAPSSPAASAPTPRCPGSISLGQVGPPEAPTCCVFLARVPGHLVGASAAHPRSG